MLQAAYTRLLNRNNFISITDNDKIYHTSPEGLEELIQGLNEKITSNSRISVVDYITIANYCKSLILNPAINTFDLEVDDILLIWETRIIAIFLIHLTNGNITVTDKMLQFETGNVLDQVIYFNKNSVKRENTIPLSPTKNVNRNDNLLSSKKIKLDRQFTSLLMWIKHSGRDIILLEYYYREVFKARCSSTNDQEYLNRLELAILSVLLKRGEMMTVDSIIETSLESTVNPAIPELKNKIEHDPKNASWFCFAQSLVEEGQSHLYNHLVQTLFSRT